jgi:hypothetical protein
MTKPYDDVDATMLFAIGPDRKLFETSLRCDANFETRARTLEMGLGAHKM